MLQKYKIIMNLNYELKKNRIFALELAKNRKNDETLDTIRGDVGAGRAVCSRCGCTGDPVA
jgi:hypothetical protein